MTTMTEFPCFCALKVLPLGNISSTQYWEQSTFFYVVSGDGTCQTKKVIKKKNPKNKNGGPKAGYVGSWLAFAPNFQLDFYQNI